MSSMGDIQRLQAALDAHRSPFWYAVGHLVDELLETEPLASEEGYDDNFEYINVEAHVDYAVTILKDMAEALPTLFRKEILERAIAQME